MGSYASSYSPQSYYGSAAGYGSNPYAAYSQPAASSYYGSSYGSGYGSGYGAGYGANTGYGAGYGGYQQASPYAQANPYGQSYGPGGDGYYSQQPQAQAQAPAPAAEPEPTASQSLQDLLKQQGMQDLMQPQPQAQPQAQKKTGLLGKVWKVAVGLLAAAGAWFVGSKIIGGGGNKTEGGPPVSTFYQEKGKPDAGIHSLWGETGPTEPGQEIQFATKEGRVLSKDKVELIDKDNTPPATGAAPATEGGEAKPEEEAPSSEGEGKPA